MTDDELKQLNALLAEKVMGYVRSARDTWWICPGRPRKARVLNFNPTYSISQAMQVAEVLRKKGWRVIIHLRPEGYIVHCFRAESPGDIWGRADKLPLAMAFAFKQVAEVGE